MQTISFLFKKKCLLFYFFNLRCSCLYYIYAQSIFCIVLTRLSAICFIANLFFKRNFKRGELNLELQCFTQKIIFPTCLNWTNKVTSRLEMWNLRVIDNDFAFQVYGFLHIVQKGEVWITSHRLLWRSLVFLE